MKKYYFLIMIVLGFCSCQKEMSYTTPTTAEADVYVAGFVFDYNSTTQGYSKIPAYWKNGRLVLIDSADYATDYLGGAVANSIAVSGNDVYVAGYS